MIKKLVVFFLLMANLSFAQSQDSPRGWLSLETDPFTTIFGAKTLSATIEPKSWQHWSLFLNVSQADFPNWMDDLLNPNNKGKGFDAKIDIGAGFGIDYFFDSERKGTYIGVINLFFDNKISAADLNANVLTHNIIPRIGYRWYPFEKRHFYLNPFAGFRYEYSLEERPSLGGQNFESAGLQPFGTLHIGVHF